MLSFTETAYIFDGSTTILSPGFSTFLTSLNPVIGRERPWKHSFSHAFAWLYRHPSSLSRSSTFLPHASVWLEPELGPHPFTLLSLVLPVITMQLLDRDVVAVVGFLSMYLFLLRYGAGGSLRLHLHDGLGLGLWQLLLLLWRLRPGHWLGLLDGL